MKLLLCKSIDTLGIVGDIVEVAAGYGRNYLVPHGLAVKPTDTNVRKLAEARRKAEQEVIENRKLLEAFAARLEGAEVTISARTNEDGILYGSVGPKEIAAALVEEGHPVKADQVKLEAPIRQLDNVAAEIRVTDDLRSTIKVWVVRDKTSEDDKGSEDGKEASSHGDDRANG